MGRVWMRSRARSWSSGRSAQSLFLKRQLSLLVSTMSPWQVSPSRARKRHTPIADPHTALFGTFHSTSLGERPRRNDASRRAAPLRTGALATSWWGIWNITPGPSKLLSGCRGQLVAWRDF